MRMGYVPVWLKFWVPMFEYGDGSVPWSFKELFSQMPSQHATLIWLTATVK